MSDSLMFLVMTPGALFSLSWKTFSMTEISVAVVSNPQKAAQSLTTSPPAMTSLPRLTVPALTQCSISKSCSEYECFRCLPLMVLEAMSSIHPGLQ